MFLQCFQYTDNKCKHCRYTINLCNTSMGKFLELLAKRSTHLLTHMYAPSQVLSASQQSLMGAMLSIKFVDAHNTIKQNSKWKILFL